jgi:hypothetical protein
MKETKLNFNKTFKGKSQLRLIKYIYIYLLTREFRQEEALFLCYRRQYHRLGGCSLPLTAEARIQFQVSPYVIF